MVAALFEGDLRYGLTVFGKPTSLDGILTPNNYVLPDTLRRCVDVDFTFYEGVELFRAFRFEDDANNLTLFSIQTHAYSISSGRAGPFIGAGIFARAAVNPVSLVKALRELLHGAQAVLMRDGRFIVQEIGANEKRLVNIPDSIDTVPNRYGHWLDKPIKTSHAKHMLILPSAAGVKSPEEFFSNVIFNPYAYSSNSFYCEDIRVTNDCKQRSNEFDVLANEKALERHCLVFAQLVYKKSEYEQALALKEKNHSHALAKTRGEYENHSLQIRSDLDHLREQNSRLNDRCTELNSTNKKLKRDLEKYDSDSWSIGKIAIFALALLLVVGAIGGIGFSIYKAWPFFQDSDAKHVTAPRVEKQPTPPPGDTSSRKDSNADVTQPVEKK
jgi:hypothetical protein